MVCVKKEKLGVEDRGPMLWTGLVIMKSYYFPIIVMQLYLVLFFNLHFLHHFLKFAALLKHVYIFVQKLSCP